MREIRAATGLSLPVAMKYAKLLLQNRSLYGTEHYGGIVYCPCCGPDDFAIRGPRGKFVPEDAK